MVNIEQCECNSSSKISMWMKKKNSCHKIGYLCFEFVLLEWFEQKKGELIFEFAVLEYW